jgi:tRNA (guanine37-N1)-methyltransferase
MIKFSVLTLFPKIITSYTSETILGRAQKKKLIDVAAIYIRDFTHDKHKTVDDTPYGGGAGMLMKPDPIYEALVSIDGLPFKKAPGLTKLKRLATGTAAKRKCTVLLSPRGRQFDQSVAESWAGLDELILICGRYEGVDQRVVDHMIDEEISIGPYVLAGGELGALTIIEAVSRLVPGVLGNAESLAEETYNQLTKSKEQKTKGIQEIEVEYPQYTKPVDFKGWKVPEVLLSGDHKKIAEWRKGKSIKS